MAETKGTAVVLGTGPQARTAVENLAGLGLRVLAFASLDEGGGEGGRFSGLPVLSLDAALALGPERVAAAVADPGPVLDALAARGIDPASVLLHPGLEDPARGVYHLLGHERYAHPGWRYLYLPLNFTCNLNCRHCVNLPGDECRAWVRPFDTFVRHLSAFDPGRFESLALHGGEIGLLPRAMDYFQEAARRGWGNFSLVTNGTGGGKPHFSRLMEDGLLGELFISIEAASPGLYRSIRGVDMERFLDFAAWAVARKRETGSTACLTFSVACMDANMEELPDIADLAGRLGLDRVLFFPIYTHTDIRGEDGRPEDWADKLCVEAQRLDHVARERAVDVFGRIRDTARKHGLVLTLPRHYPELEGGPEPARHFRCPTPFEWVAVWGGGEVHPCCQGGMSLPYLGSIEEESFEDIWRGPFYRRLISGLAPGGRPYARCPGCNTYKGYTPL